MIDPDFGRSKVANILNNVDLPAPSGPKNPMRLGVLSSRFRFVRTGVLGLYENERADIFNIAATPPVVFDAPFLKERSEG
jgi:hypothetical protein